MKARLRSENSASEDELARGRQAKGEKGELVEPARYFKLCFEKRFYFEQLIEVAGALHEREVLFYITQYIGQASRIDNAEV